MERFVFFVYNLIASDERYKPGSKEPVYSTLFLVSFLELFLFLPLILFTNEIFQIVSLKSFLALPVVMRYLLIFAQICLIGSVNYYFFARNDGMERLAVKYADKKNAYLRRKWYLILFAMVLGILVMGALTLIRMMMK